MMGDGVVRGVSDTAFVLKPTNTDDGTDLIIVLPTLGISETRELVLF